MRFTWVLWDQPTPTPAPTGTPPPPPSGGRYGERCIYTPTLGGPPVEGFASVLENGGFETWDFMVPPPWIASAPGGFVPALGDAYEGSKALYINYQRPANYWQYYQVYDFANILPTGDWRANVGFAAQCFSIGLPAYDCPIGFAGADFTVATSGIWRVYSATVPGVYPVDGGTVSMGELTAGDGALILDAMWVIYEHLGDGGQWDVWCPEPRPDDPNATPTSTATPWLLPTIPLPTLRATPTLGPQPTFPPPVEITPAPTSCYGIAPDTSGFGVDVPSVGVCLAPSVITVTSPILEPIVAVVIGLLGSLLAAAIVAMIIQLFRIGQ